MRSPALTIPAGKLDHTVEVLKAVAHPIRLQIVMLLCQREHSVSEMYQLLDVRQSVVSQHLALMRRMGLVAAERGRSRGTYRLEEPQLRDIIQCVLKCNRR